MISQAPIIFTTTLLLSMLGAFFLCRWLYGEALTRQKQVTGSLREQMALLQPDHLAQFETQIRERDARILNLSDQLESPLPEIEIQILEASVQAPHPAIGWCFLNVRLHNKTEKSPCIIDTWLLTLNLDNEARKAVRAFDSMANFRLAQYVEVPSIENVKSFIVHYHFGENGLPMTQFASDEVTDLRSLITQANPLRRGFPQTGWIGFSFMAPTWPTKRVEPAAAIEEPIIIRKTTSVRSITFEIADGHGGKHSATKQGPFWSEEREFVKLDPELD